MQEDVEHSRQVEGLRTDLEMARRKLGQVQKSLSTKEDKLVLTETVLEETKTELAEKVQAFAEQQAQLRKVQGELETLKKSDAFIFGEIATLQQQPGQLANALKRYQKFITDFPKSPLVASAASAINRLSVSSPVAGQPAATSRPAATPVDPRVRERELLKNFNEGYMTLAELAPILKKKSLAQVLALLGRPNQTYHDGTEIGYADKAINPATGGKGMLIIAFEEDAVSSLRVEYAGRKMTP